MKAWLTGFGRAEALWAASQALCAGQALDPALVTNRSEIVEMDRRLALNEPVDDLHLMKGWRRNALGQALLDLLAGKHEFTHRWDWSGMHVAPRSEPT